MHKTSSTGERNNSILWNTETLVEKLDCGRTTAVKIGTDAKARVQIGKRVLWNAEKIKAFLASSNEQ